MGGAEENKYWRERNRDIERREEQDTRIGRGLWGGGVGRRGGGRSRSQRAGQQVETIWRRVNGRNRRNRVAWRRE